MPRTCLSIEGDFSFVTKDKTFEESGIFGDLCCLKYSLWASSVAKSQNPLPDHLRSPFRKSCSEIFGRTDILGESFRVQNKYDLKVTAVYEDMPHHSTICEDLYFVIPFQVWRNEDNASREDWDNNGTLTLVILREDADAAACKRENENYY